MFTTSLIYLKNKKHIYFSELPELKVQFKSINETYKKKTNSPHTPTYSNRDTKLNTGPNFYSTTSAHIILPLYLNSGII